MLPCRAAAGQGSPSRVPDDFGLTIPQLVVWQGSWTAPAETKIQIVLPAEGLKSGPHTLVTVDSTGRLRSFPFQVP